MKGNKFNAGKLKQKFPSSPLVASIIQSFIELPPFSIPMKHPRKRTNVLSLRLKEQKFRKKRKLNLSSSPTILFVCFPGSVYIYMSYVYTYIIYTYTYI